MRPALFPIRPNRNQCLPHRIARNPIPLRSNSNKLPVRRIPERRESRDHDVLAQTPGHRHGPGLRACRARTPRPAHFYRLGRSRKESPLAGSEQDRFRWHTEWSGQNHPKSLGSQRWTARGLWPQHPFEKSHKRFLPTLSGVPRRR